MDNRYYDNVVAEIKPFLAELGFEEKEDAFVSEQRAFSVTYDESRQLYILSAANVENGEIGEYSVIDSWLFDDSQTERDAKSVGYGFIETLRKHLGVKNTVSATKMVELPTASKDGVVDIASFTKKILDVFPALKDEYKNHISVYGNFLYLNFYGQHLIPRVIRLFETGSKKQITKFYNILSPAYQKGDKDTINTVVVILAAAAYNNEKVTEEIKSMLSEDTHFCSSFINMLYFFSKDKKLKKALIK